MASTRPLAVAGPHRPVETVEGGCRTVGELWLRRVSSTPDTPAHHHKVDGRWLCTTWRQLDAEARSAARGLVELGLEAGERIAILGPTHPQWAAYDLAGQLLGLVTVGIYPLQAPEQVRYILEHSESRVVFVADDTELKTVLAASEGLGSLQAIVPWTDELSERYAAAEARIVGPDGFRGAPLERAELEQRLAAVEPEATAILIYTSGTTGPPKAAMIAHRNVLALAAAHREVIAFYQDDLLLSFLPMAHVTERNLGFYCRINTGVTTAYASSIGAVLGELPEVRPTVFGSVPRLFEKAYDRIQGEISRKPAPIRTLFTAAVAVARDRLHRRIAGEPVPWHLELRFRLARRLVFAKIHAAFGGRVRACIVGAAPIAPQILEFLWAIDLPIYEGYGLTEATVLSHINTAAAFRLGTVGRPVAPGECRLAADGEILLRGPFVFQGYLKNPEATAETIRDGWLHTGDIGVIDADGYLKITDRKKHLIVTAGGKNVAPANVERALKNQSPLISHVHAHGDGRPFIAAILAPSPLETLEWGLKHGSLGGEEFERLQGELLANPSGRSGALNAAMARIAADERFQRLFLEPVQRGNRSLARVERVRRFAVLDRDFSQEEGELTPTMKAKRKVVEERYRELFDRLYSDGSFGIDAEPRSEA